MRRKPRALTSTHQSIMGRFAQQMPSQQIRSHVVAPEGEGVGPGGCLLPLSHHELLVVSPSQSLALLPCGTQSPAPCSGRSAQSWEHFLVFSSWASWAS